jgi:tetratricopeptide (TPR) repeat protein
MADDTMLNEAIEALQNGDKVRAKDLLTRLLKTDQSNATYWVWLSAVVETQKERIYCLQTALKLDPNNVSAKRGLVLFGALKLDEKPKPFPMDHPIPWEESLKKLEEDTPKGLKAAWGNPFIRLILLAGTALLLVAVVWAGFNVPRATYRRPTRTPGPSQTYTLTPTALNAGTQFATPSYFGPTPLWMLLEATYTPTPLYVVTQHPITSSDAYNAGIRYFKQGNYQDAITLMKQVATLEPNSAADAWYYIGEAYRLSGENVEAKKAFDQAISIDPNFGIAYLGRATVTLAINPEANVITDLNKALELDPTYAPIYVERAGFFLANNELEAARSDIEKALELAPGSSMAYFSLAKLEMNLGNYPEALAAAQKANELDVTILPIYLILGQAYRENGQYQEAVRILEIYNNTSPGDSNAMLYLATGYNAAGEYQKAITLLESVLSKEKRRAEAYYQRGMAYLGLEEFKKASTDFQTAVGYDSQDFDAHIGLARAYLGLGFPGDAYVEIKDHAAKLGQSDEKKAQVYYWEATALDALENASALIYWQSLLDLPEDIMPAEWRITAQERIQASITASPTSEQTQTPISTPTPMRTLTRTPTPTHKP